MTNKVPITPLAALPLLLSGCNAQLQAELFGNRTGATSRGVQPNEMRSGELTNQQFSRLIYLAPGQSRRAMDSWSERKYPRWVNSTTEIYEINDQPGTCVQLNYSSDATYQGWQLVRC